MRQETTNTFDKGLNKDLNPIVTPNNVLTDCLNGTFITFNGDELTLQNDAGNTSIIIQETGQKVRLSPGFYPIGIKEYGGVLYIVSGKKEIGKPDLIEFGSYPAPIQSKGSLNPGIPTEVKDNSLLYESIILNDTTFKTGGYAVFDSIISVGSDNLQIPAGNGAKEGIYKIRLLHQLNNGSFDLTNDVWEKFREHKIRTGSTKTHWIDSVDGDIVFKYFCPNQYKGKLVVVIELDEPPLFEFETLPTAELQSENYKLTLDQLKWEGSKTIPIVGYDWKLIFADGSVKTPANGGDNPFIIPLENNLVSYEVTPKTSYDWEDFPKIFRDKYVLKGTVLLAERYYSIYFERAEGVCVEGKALKRYQLLVLSNSSGRLGLDLENVKGDEKPVAFIIEHHSVYKPEERYNLLGTYGIKDNKAVIRTTDSVKEGIIKEQPEGVQLLEVIKRKLANTEVVLEDSSCGEFDIYIKFNLNFDTENPNKPLEDILKFYYIEGKDNKMVSYTIIDNRTFKIPVNINRDLIIWRSGVQSYTTHKIDKNDFIADKTFHIAIVTKFVNPTYVIKAGANNNFVPDKMNLITEYSSYVNRDLFLRAAPNIVLNPTGVGQNNKKTTISNFSFRETKEREVYLEATVTNPPAWPTMVDYTFSGGSQVGPNDYYNIKEASLFRKYKVDGVGDLIIPSSIFFYVSLDYSEVNPNF